MVNTYSSYPVLSKTEPFRVFHAEDTFVMNAQDIIGEIIIKDGGLTLSCDYKTIVENATEQAKRMGGNILRIYEHKEPNNITTCHGIKAKVLRIEEAWQYENEIEWNKDRRLKIRDFKGNIKKLDMITIAMTASGFKLHYRGNRMKGDAKVIAIAYFKCFESPFKITLDSIRTLEHEQIHFDITELHARKLIQHLDIESDSFDELSNMANDVIRKIQLELSIMQKEYDKDVLEDQKNQQIWKVRIAKELVALNRYESKQLEMPFGGKRKK